MDKLKDIESIDIAKVDFLKFQKEIEEILKEKCENEETAAWLLMVHPKYNDYKSIYEHSRQFKYKTRASLEDYYALCKVSKLQMPVIPNFVMENNAKFFTVKDLLKTVYSICRSKMIRLDELEYKQRKEEYNSQMYFLLNSFLEGTEGIALSPELYGYLINYHETDPPFSYTIKKGIEIPDKPKKDADTKTFVAKWRQKNEEKVKNVEWLEAKPNFPAMYYNRVQYGLYIKDLMDVLEGIGTLFEHRKRNAPTDRIVYIHMIIGSLYSNYEDIGEELHCYNDISRLRDTHSILRSKKIYEGYDFYEDIIRQVKDGEKACSDKLGVSYNKEKVNKIIERCKEENCESLEFCGYLYYRYLLSVIANFLVHKFKECNGDINCIMNRHKCEIDALLKIGQRLIGEKVNNGFSVKYSRKNIDFMKELDHKEPVEVNKKEKSNTTNCETRFGS